MKVLSIDQMSRLKELGIDVKPKGFGIIHQFDGGDSYRLIYGESTCEDDMVAFDLQDIIELLPKEITTITEKRYVSITECYQLNWNPINGLLRYDNVWDGDCTVLYGVCYTEEEGILFAAYHLLVWVAENGHLSTKTI